MTTQERIDRINAVKEAKAAGDARRLEERSKKTAELLAQLKGLAPRIKDLITVAQALWDAGQGNGEFLCDSWAHKIGFVCSDGINYRNFVPQRPEYMGQYGGGYCGTDIIVDSDGHPVQGRFANGTEPIGTETWNGKAQCFINGFDAFEKQFYGYVDNL